MFNYPKNSIWQCFQTQIVKSAPETQIKPNAVVANVQLPKKRELTTISHSYYEIYSINANKGTYMQ